MRLDFLSVAKVLERSERFLQIFATILLVNIYKLGALLILVLIFIGENILIASAFKTVSRQVEFASQHPKVLGIAKSVEASEISSSSANLTLKPQDGIEVVPAVIIEVVDVNTVRVLLNDGMDIVKLIGIKSAGDNSLLKFEKCYGQSVISQIQSLALGKKVYLINDREYEGQQTSKKYIFLEDMTFLNKVLIEKGLARASIDDSLYMYKNDFKEADNKAQEDEAGVWMNSCKTTPTPTAIPKQATKNSIKSTPTPTTSTNLYSRLLVTATPTPTPLQKGQASLTPSPTTTPITKSQTETSNTNSETKPSSSKPASLNPEILFVLINNHRKEIGKPAFEKDSRLCSLAVERGPELSDEIFVNHNVHSGLYNRNLPYWITENMASYASEEQIFNWWMGSTIHKKAIESDNKYSCGECWGNSCAQLFTSWVPK